MAVVTTVVGVVLVAAGVLAAGHGYRRRRQRQAIAAVETTDALRVTPGPAEVYGEAIAAESPLGAPFTDEDCLLAEWEIEEWEESGDHSSWRTEGSGTLAAPFHVADETGEVLVRPEAATVDLSGSRETIEVGVDETPPEPIRSFVELDSTPDEPSEAPIGALDWGTQIGDRRYHQRTLAPGESVFVHGTATRVGAESFGDPDLEIVEAADDGHPDAGVFLVADGTEAELLERRRDAAIYLAGGGLAVVAGVVVAAVGTV